MSDTLHDKSNTSFELDAAAEALALSTILALGEQQVREGKTVVATEALQRFRAAERSSS